MDAMKLLLLYLACVVAGNTEVVVAVNGYGSDFVFPSLPGNSFVKLVLPPGKIFPETYDATFCFYTHEENKLGETYALFSYGNDDPLRRVGASVNEEYTNFYVLGSATGFFIAEEVEDGAWDHHCFSYSGSKRKGAYYLNGILVKRNAFYTNRNSPPIKGGSDLILGQVYDDGLQTPLTENEELGFRGRMTQFNVWDRFLKLREVKKVMEGKLRGNIVDWKQARWELNGQVELQPSTAPGAN